jgi:hypothetical protein
MAFVIINDLSGGTTSTVRQGNDNTVYSPFSTVSGGRLNTVTNLA